MIRRCLIRVGLLIPLVACTAAPPPPAPPATSVTTVKASVPSPPAVAPPTPSPSPSPSPTPVRPVAIRLTTEAASPAQWSLFVAARKGFYRRYSLQVQIDAPSASGATRDPLASPSADLVSTSAEGVIRAIESGANLRIVAGQLNKPVYELVVARDVATFSDLRGKPLAVADPKSGLAVLLRKVLAARGLRDVDYTLVSLASPEDQAAAIANGTAAAALLDQPRSFQLLARGFRALALASDTVPDYQVTVLAAQVNWARLNDDALVRCLKAVAEADTWLYDPSNRAEAAAILSETARLPSADALKTYDLLVQKTQALPSSAEISPPGLRATIDFLGEAGVLRRPLPPPDKYVDSSFLDRATR